MIGRAGDGVELDWEHTLFRLFADVPGTSQILERLSFAHYPQLFLCVIIREHREHWRSMPMFPVFYLYNTGNNREQSGTILVFRQWIPPDQDFIDARTLTIKPKFLG